MSPLHGALDEYLRVRRALGFALEREGQVLLQFLAYLEHHGSDTITVALALDWTLSPPGVSRQWAGTRMAMVRGFATHLAALDPRTEVPPADLLPTLSRTRLIPYVYTDEEICTLMAAARTLDSRARPTPP